MGAHVWTTALLSFTLVQIQFLEILGRTQILYPRILDLAIRASWEIPAGPEHPMDLEILVLLEMGPTTSTSGLLTKICVEVLTEMGRETAFRTTDSADHRAITTDPGPDREDNHHHHPLVRTAWVTARLSCRKVRR